ncbi:MAG: ATP-dependent helicase [Burkholderiaceae bacterium]|nr:ATP-dependent helicase [Burkholderiaceae bacterium]
MPGVKQSPATTPLWLERLNPQQRLAATWGEVDDQGNFAAGPLLVIAGAGTGKTATLAHRVAHLVMAGVDPDRILLLTFSRRAAQEMIRRAERLVFQALTERHGGNHAATVRLRWAGTFHAIGARLLRHYAARLGLDPGFGILDRGDSADLLDVVRHDCGFSSERRRFPRKDACLAIYSYRVNTGWPLEQVLDEHYPWCRQWLAQLQQLFRGYVERKQVHGVLDYDDLLLWWHAGVQDQAVAREIGARFDHVLVDEYQDTNALQASILLAIKPDGAGVTVVGDDAQSIYRFRAADVGNILAFPENFAPPARRVTLEENYRSVQAVLDAANALIAEGSRQYPKTLRAARVLGKGVSPRLATVLDDRAQAEYVIREVLEAREAGTALRRQAVLFRSSHHSDVLEVELLRSNIPFVKYGGLKFLESAHVKDLLAVLRWADNPRNGIAAFRALQLMAGVGPRSAQRCLEHLAAAAPAPSLDAAAEPRPRATFAALASFAAPATDGEQWQGFARLMTVLVDPATPWPGQVAQVRRWYQPLLERCYDDAGVRAADLDMLANISGEFACRERFLTELTLDPPQASGDLAGDPLRDEDYLILSTVHSAKGQEWDSVYVLNVADGNFPNEFTAGNAAAIEEERRLLYVAITRARDRLHLIEPLRYYVTHQPRLGGAYVHGARSRFLTPAVLGCFETVAPAVTDPDRELGAPAGAPLDVAATMRGMW